MQELLTIDLESCETAKSSKLDGVRVDGRS